MCGLAPALHCTVFIPGLEFTSTSPQLPQKSFMGFGYNGTLAQSGERLEMLDFFSWMKKLQIVGVQEWTIWDASSYFVVNKLPAQPMICLGSEPSAQQVLEVIVEEFRQPKRAEVVANCDRRSEYLKLLVEISGINVRYLDARKVFLEDSEYTDALDVALEFARKLAQDSPDLVARITLDKQNPGSRLYLPLEIAEAFYLNLKYGIGGKYGPQTEQYFDEAIVQLEESWDVLYVTLRSPLGPRKPGYLDDANVLVTGMSDREVRRLLTFDKPYSSWISEVIAVFRKDEETVADCSVRMLGLLNGGELP